ncbi:MAG: hypothetical protein LUC18_04590 [Porphyromonadaceae bacterium]|nr:hypothetical protein [Porphyromonadaceae bacterium]
MNHIVFWTDIISRFAFFYLDKNVFWKLKRVSVVFNRHSTSILNKWQHNLSRLFLGDGKHIGQLTYALLQIPPARKDGHYDRVSRMQQHTYVVVFSLFTNQHDAVDVIA